MENPMGQQAQAGATLINPNAAKQLTIIQVENGFLLSPPFYGGSQKVATNLEDALKIMETYFK